MAVANVNIQKTVLKFLKNQPTAVVATATPDGQPQVATLFYTIDNDFTFSFVTSDLSRKFQNLVKNNRVAIVVGTGPELVTVPGGGRARVIDYASQTEEAERVLQKVLKESQLRRAPDWPVLLEPKKHYGVFQVKPDWLVWLNLEYQKRPEGYVRAYQVVLPEGK